MALSKITTASLADDSVTGAKIENNPTIAGNLTVSGEFIPSEAIANKNIIINGNFSVDQRGITKSGGIHSGNGDYNLDKWTIEDSGNIDNLVMNITQHADTPNGFDGYCLKYQCKTVESAVAADEFYSLNQYVESRNLQHLGFGTADAKSITVSFWVKSSLTGTFGFSIYQDDGGDIVSAPYTINSADTWEKKTLTFAGNTADSPANDNTRGWKVQWGLWVGSNYNTTATSTWTTYSNARRFGGHVQNGLATVDESTWQLAFVQVEAGSTATAFEHETYDETLRKCQRYFVMDKAGSAYKRYLQGICTTTVWTECLYYYPVPMRAQPSIGSSGNNGHYLVEYYSNSAAASEAPSRSSHSSETYCCVNIRVASGLTAGDNVAITSYNTTDGYLSYNADF